MMALRHLKADAIYVARAVTVAIAIGLLLAIGATPLLVAIRIMLG